MTVTLAIVLHPTFYNHIILESDSLCSLRWQKKWTKSRKQTTLSLQYQSKGLSHTAVRT